MYLFTLFHSPEFVVLILILALRKEFKDKRKIHYNEYSKVKLARKLIEQELKDLDDDDDSLAKNTKETPSSSQDGADTQVIKCICYNNQTNWWTSKEWLWFFELIQFCLLLNWLIDLIIILCHNWCWLLKGLITVKSPVDNQSNMWSQGVCPWGDPLWRDWGFSLWSKSANQGFWSHCKGVDPRHKMQCLAVKVSFRVNLKI